MFILFFSFQTSTIVDCYDCCFVIYPLPKKDFVTKLLTPVPTSVKEEKHIILQTTLNIAVRRGTLRTYALKNTPKVF